jgi:hypothetical protein
VPGELEEILIVLVPYEPPYRIIGTAKVAFGFELQISHQASLWTSHIAVIAELVLHFTEQDAAHIDVWLCDEAGHALA